MSYILVRRRVTLLESEVCPDGPPRLREGRRQVAAATQRVEIEECPSLVSALLVP